MINYLLVSAALLIIFAAIQLGQHRYILSLDDKQDLQKIHQMAFWGTVISSITIGIGFLIIGLVLFTRHAVQKQLKPLLSKPSAPLAQVAKPPVFTSWKPPVQI